MNSINKRCRWYMKVFQFFRRCFIYQYVFEESAQNFHKKKTFHDASKMIDLQGKADLQGKEWRWYMIPCCIFWCRNERKVPVVYEIVSVFSYMLHISIGFWRICSKRSKLFNSFHDALKMTDLKGRAPTQTHFNNILTISCDMTSISKKYRWYMKCFSCFEDAQYINTFLKNLFKTFKKVQNVSWCF